MINFQVGVIKIIDRKKMSSMLYRGPGVYVFLDAKYNATYVGKSINIFERVKTHISSTDAKEKALTEVSEYIYQVPVAHELEALLLEAALIKKYLPKYNSAAKDDKHPLYIKITNEEFPKIFTSRRQEKGATYFGPFPSSLTVRNVLEQVRRVFPYCSQIKIGKRACFYSHLGLCAPCPAVISKLEGTLRESEAKKYMQNLRKIHTLLKGKEKVLKKTLKKDIDRLAGLQHFEEAARFRDQLQALFYITSPYKSVNEYMENPKLLEKINMREINALYETLVDYIPGLMMLNRIECFDNAHLSGENATSSLVVFIRGVAEKRLYRRFRIRTKRSNDDFEMMREVIVRRVRHIQDWGKPDLIVVDGGKGQVSVVSKALKDNFDGFIPIIGLAKRLEEIVIPVGETFKIIRLRPGSPALSLLQRMRDEAHRFARKYHFKLRLKKLLQ